ncbi:MULTISPECIES: beta-ketoacyl-ACP synthase [Bartonella]|uniref:beta-ketoacyl-ACP synthase n=1 Tax=Bartonella TaxID=773 RepID=UPI0018DE96B0|nr:MULTISPECIES: beta-ketoacyl-ACP synthase [Bartonella]MBH9994516.1 beta-ketoacyl-ACP synthase [Bartonella sp. P0291]MBH9997139.1 beta-ketoacyl-ACP synthase [Bartonella sp. M0192]MBH9999299.1 beta-ketoacyl-ACP synthase [Bartonella sp. M0191]MBI0007219.1 beta-ketoacyl-ACP synthase [Bartonella sp. M0193]MBI0010590.1 beta-ketoacyl-ACP synthase [Bartonella sp. M0176]
MQKNHSVVITGIGLISSLGEGVEKHWEMLNASSISPRIDSESFSPYAVHALGDVDWSKQIPKRSDQRQMETWQRLGTYAAGLALDDAGVKGDLSITSTMDMIVGAGGGERDVNVDVEILNKGRTTTDRGVMLNATLSTELRPTLFLAQLSNLLAGNISIVHKVIGSSRSFMGEEGSGLAALMVAIARIRSGQSTHALVGGSYNAQHYDMLLGQELGQLLKRDGWSPVWQRENCLGGGLVTGSGGVFLVLESAEYAKKRGANIYAVISDFVADQTNRKKIPIEKTLDTILERVKGNALLGQNDLIVSGASGVKGITGAEKTLWDKNKLAYRGISTLFGHWREAQFPLALALGAMAMKKKQSFKALSDDEQPFDGNLESVIVSTVGATRAEGMARLIAG